MPPKGDTQKILRGIELTLSEIADLRADFREEMRSLRGDFNKLLREAAEDRRQAAEDRRQAAEDWREGAGDRRRIARIGVRLLENQREQTRVLNAIHRTLRAHGNGSNGGR